MLPRKKNYFNPLGSYFEKCQSMEYDQEISDERKL